MYQLTFYREESNQLPLKKISKTHKCEADSLATTKLYIDSSVLVGHARNIMQIYIITN